MQPFRRWLAGLVLALSSALAPAQILLPDFGNSADAVFSGAVEREVGEAFMRELRATTDIVEEPEIETYVQSLGYRLVSAADQQQLGFSFFVVRNQAINAFAAPGGYVGFNTGLIVATESESELASVVAHEVSHVTQRHIARFVEAGEQSMITTLAGILAAIAIGTQSPEAGSAAAAAVLGSQAQSALNFTRANEKEADRVGMQILDKAGFDPAAMAIFFERLQNSSRYYRTPPEWLSTHPVSTSRIAEARGRAAQLGFRQHSDSLDYRLVRAKVRVLSEPDTELLTARFNEEIQNAAPAPSPGLRYGLALLDARARRFDAARKGLEALTEQFPSNTALRVALANVILASGATSEAMAMLDDTWRLLPDNRLVTRSYAQALLATGKAQDVLRVLDEHQRFASLDAEMFHQRAQALEALGRTAESQIALAEHFERRGQLDRAIHQLKLASRDAGNDFYRASRIEAKLEELRGQQAQRARR